MDINLEFINVKDVPNTLQKEIRNWRNSKEVSKWFQIKYIDEDTHDNWISNLYNENPKTIAFIVKNSICNKNIGFTYFLKIDYLNKCADWGIYLYPKEHQGNGYGSCILSKMIDYAKNVLKLNTVYLEVLKKNTKAIMLYEKFDFKLVSQTETVYKYKLVINTD